MPIYTVGRVSGIVGQAHSWDWWRGRVLLIGAAVSVVAGRGATVLMAAS